MTKKSTTRNMFHDPRTSGSCIARRKAGKYYVKGLVFPLEKSVSLLKIFYGCRIGRANSESKTGRRDVEERVRRSEGLLDSKGQGGRTRTQREIPGLSILCQQDEEAPFEKEVLRLAQFRWWPTQQIDQVRYAGGTLRTILYPGTYL